MYEVWVVRPNESEELLLTFEFEYQADFVCNELNIAASDEPGCGDYRVCFNGAKNVPSILQQDKQAN